MKHSRKRASPGDILEAREHLRYIHLVANPTAGTPAGGHRPVGNDDLRRSLKGHRLRRRPRHGSLSSTCRPNWPSACRALASRRGKRGRAVTGERPAVPCAARPANTALILTASAVEPGRRCLSVVNGTPGPPPTPSCPRRATRASKPDAAPGLLPASGARPKQSQEFMPVLDIAQKAAPTRHRPAQRAAGRRVNRPFARPGSPPPAPPPTAGSSGRRRLRRPTPRLSEVRAARRHRRLVVPRRPPLPPLRPGTALPGGGRVRRSPPPPARRPCSRRSTACTQCGMPAYEIRRHVDRGSITQSKPARAWTRACSSSHDPRPRGKQRRARASRHQVFRLARSASRHQVLAALALHHQRHPAPELTGGECPGLPCQIDRKGQPFRG